MKRADTKLTKRLIDSLVFDGDRHDSQVIVWDAELSGFGVRVRPNGRKTFVLSYRHEGRKHIMQIGDYGPLTLEKARKLARVTSAGVIQGKNPLAERVERARGSTMADVCKEYVQRHAALKKTASEDERRINTHILPAWGGIKARSIKRADVAGLHHRIGQNAPYEANRVLALISVIFEKAREWGFLPDEHVNPARGVQPFKETKRDRWVKPEELPRLAEAIDKEPNVYVRAALWSYLLTGARKNELLKARWEHVDLNRKELELPDTKAGRKHYIPLSAPALAVLESLPRQEGNPHLFAGRVAGGHLVNIGKSWRRIRKEAKLEDVRLHDLRRTVGSWLATSGASLPLIGKVLNHTQPSTTAIYARLAEDPARKALDEHAERLMDTVKKLRVVNP